MLFIDLDGFKAINDTLGHEAGDAVLVEAGRRLTATARKTDTVARLGGDELVVLCTELRECQCVSLVAERVVRALRPPLPGAAAGSAVRGQRRRLLHLGPQLARPSSCTAPTWPCTRPSAPAGTATLSLTPRATTRRAQRAGYRGAARAAQTRPGPTPALDAVVVRAPDVRRLTAASGPVWSTRGHV